MANKHDARPFVDLQKDADEFQAKFEEDIEKCKSILDAKITALICDPDSLGNSVALKQNALVEFSKAKYDIYISMKSLMNEMEREWLKYISEMKKLFIDNVEVFLANTKLEVKFPSSGSLLSSGPKKSFGSKTTEVTGSIISNITKSIPGFTQKKKSLDREMEKNERDMASLYDNLKHKKNPSPLKKSSLHAPMNTIDLSENDDEEINESKQYVSELPSLHNHKGRFTDEKGKIYEIYAKDASSSESQGETSEFESEVTHANSRKSNRSTSRSRGTAVYEERSNNSDESEEAMETETNNKYNESSKARKGKQASKTQANTKKIYAKDASSFENQRETEFESELTHANSRKSTRSTVRYKRAAISEERSNNSDESEEAMETETSNNKYNASSKTRKGKQASKTPAHTKTFFHHVVMEEKVDSEPECEEDLNGVSVMSNACRGKSVPAKNVAAKTSRPPGRPSRRKTVNEIVIERDEETSIPQPSRSVTRRKTLLPNVKEFESDEETSIPQPSRSVTRRKTLLPNVKEFESGNHTSGRSKRKTIIGVSDLASEAPAKRLKHGNTQKTNTTEGEDAVTDINLLENDSYSEWISLKSIDGKIPTVPGIYEVKVWRAKKTAYIGSCDSLRQKLTLHKLKQNSGHKHLDKFIERNYDDIQIRYEVVSSVNDAKVEVKNRVNSFVAQHKTTPAYN